MARSGSFGRLPRAASSITNTVLALAREQERQEDENIMSAWQKGGLFEGKKATDDVVLAYWRDKMKDMSEDDPLTEGYRNNVLQLEYGIAQSKADLLHLQGKMSDEKFAQFYLNWAKRVPKDSEFYRVLQKQAAQLNERVAARTRQSDAQAKADAFSNYAEGVTKSHLALGDTLISVMTQIAQDNNLIGRDEDLQKFMLKGQDDPAIMEDLLASINKDMKANPAKYKGLTDAIIAQDPSWNGQLTSGYFAKTLKRQGEGYKLIETRANADGYSEYANWAKKGRASATELGIEAKAWPTGQTYTIARDKFDEVMNDPHATSADRIAASDQFAKELDKMSGNKQLDASFQNRLKNDAAALRGDPKALPQDSFFENYLGLKGTTAGTTSTGSTSSEGGAVKGEIAKWQEDMGRERTWAAAMEADPTSFVYASVKPGSDPPVFDESGKGPVGVVTAASVQQSSQATQVVPTTTISGKSIMVASPVRNIYVTDPVTGKKSSEPIGKAIVYNRGGMEQTLYGSTRPDGSPVWTPVAPWAKGVSEKRDASGDVILSMSGLTFNNSGAAAKLDADLRAKGISSSFASLFGQGVTPPPEGSTWKLNTAPSTKGKAGSETTVTVTVKGGQLVTSESTTFKDATGATTGTSSVPQQPVAPVNWAQQVRDPGRIKAGTNPNIDFDTPTMAAVSANNMTHDQVQTIWTNPMFQAILQAQEFTAARGDVLKYHQIAAQDAAIGNAISNFGPVTANTNPYAHNVPAPARTDLLYPTNKKMVEEGVNAAIQLVGNIKLPKVPDVFGPKPQFGGLSPDDRAAAAAAKPPVGITTPSATPTSTVLPTGQVIVPQPPVTAPGPVAPPKPSMTSAPKPPTPDFKRPPGHGELEY